MEVKRIFAASMKDALKLVRDSLGPEAMILSTEQVTGGIEVTATLEGPAQAAPRRASEPGLDADAWRWLKALGLSAAALDLVGRRGGDARSALADALPVLPRPVAPRSGRFAFVGAGGAGKTALVARLLTNRVLHHGRDQVVVISTDCWRPGGQDQLERLGALLDVPVLKAATPADFQRMLAAQPGNALVLVDTAGLPPGSPAFEDQRQALAAPALPLNTVLVLPVTLQARVMAAQVAAARACGATGIALTRLDEAVSLGEAFSAVLESDLPVVWQTVGAGIPDDLESPDPVDLVGRAHALAEAHAPRQGLAAGTVAADGEAPAWH